MVLSGPPGCALTGSRLSSCGAFTLTITRCYSSGVAPDFKLLGIQRSMHTAGLPVQAVHDIDAWHQQHTERPSAAHQPPQNCMTSAHVGALHLSLQRPRAGPLRKHPCAPNPQSNASPAGQTPYVIPAGPRGAWQSELNNACRAESAQRSCTSDREHLQQIIWPSHGGACKSFTRSQSQPHQSQTHLWNHLHAGCQG